MKYEEVTIQSELGKVRVKKVTVDYHIGPRFSQVISWKAYPVLIFTKVGIKVPMGLNNEKLFFQICTIRIKLIPILTGFLLEMPTIRDMIDITRSPIYIIILAIVVGGGNFYFFRETFNSSCLNGNRGYHPFQLPFSTLRGVLHHASKRCDRDQGTLVQLRIHCAQGVLKPAPW